MLLIKSTATPSKKSKFTDIKRSFSLNGTPRVPDAYNEPILEYSKGSKERHQLEQTIQAMKKQTLDVPVIVHGKEIRTNNTAPIIIPHNHKHELGRYHRASKAEVQHAIDSALEARKKWAATDFEERAAIFLRIADLISGPYRYTINASTVLGQGKNFFQAEIDAVCELVDFIRYNVQFARGIYNYEQPTSHKGTWNKLSYRPLEGFVYAVSPFNFTAIGGNLSLAPALMGNTVVWKPSDSAIFSNYYLMKLYKEAGLPDGVINFVPGDAEMVSDLVFSHREFAGIHYTGSTAVFQHIWKQIGSNMQKYRQFPKIVGESGGKDFIFAHPSANVDRLVTAMIRGAFEYAGQKCSAASRVYIPGSIWPAVQKKLLHDMAEVKMGNPEKAGTLVNAVIHKRSFDKAKHYIDYARNSSEAKIIWGGRCDDSVGYFIEPTIVLTTNPKFKLMMEEIFAPVLTVYVYADEDLHATAQICDDHPYALTGSIFAEDRYAIAQLTETFTNSAGNFYINDKPTGAVVGQQPFGGARLSGTNDKAGSYLNLLRWVSPRTIKETFWAPTHFSYPYMENEPSQ